MKGNYLLSRIPVKARLLAKRPALARALESYPLFRQIGKGSGMTYLLGNESEDRFYTIKFLSDEVILTIHSRSSPLHHMHEALLRILSAFSILEDFYEPEMRSLYPYLINLLASDQFSELSEKFSVGMAKSDSGSDLMLAKRINSLLRENADLGSRLKTARHRLSLLISKFLIMKYGSTIDLDTAAKETGIERRELEIILQEMGDFGYRKIKISDRRFSLARI